MVHVVLLPPPASKPFQLTPRRKYRAIRVLNTIVSLIGGTNEPIFPNEKKPEAGGKAIRAYGEHVLMAVLTASRQLA